MSEIFTDSKFIKILITFTEWPYIFRELINILDLFQPGLFNQRFEDSEIQD